MNKRITNGLISMYQKTTFLSDIESCGLSAERSYIQRKVFSHLFDHEGILFFFIKLIKHTSYTKCINYKKICQKLFL